MISRISQFVRWIGHFFLLLLEKVVEQVFDEKIVFNCVWEDPALDLQALQLKKDDKILMITSAGCNVLNYMLHEPAHIYSIDRNPCQNALLELKIAAIKAFDYETFWEVFGTGRKPNFSKETYPKLRHLLSEDARTFWDKHAYYFDGRGLRKSFYHRGCAGVFGWIFSNCYLRFKPALRDSLDYLFEHGVPEMSQEMHPKVESAIFSSLFERAVNNSLVLIGMMGVPRTQQKLIEGGVANFLKSALKELMYYTNICDNYFYRVYVYGEYTKKCCPEYLKEDNFNKLKTLVDRITIKTTTITEFLEENESLAISRFVLLDHMDWMAESPELLQREWQSIVNHSAPKTRYLWRSAALETEFVTSTKILYDGKVTTVGEILDFNRELASSLHKVDRVHTYQSFHIGTLKEVSASD